MIILIEKEKKKKKITVNIENRQFSKGPQNKY